MNGAESMLETLVNNGVEVCFTNPGTSEMHMVSAIGCITTDALDPLSVRRQLLRRRRRLRPHGRQTRLYAVSSGARAVQRVG